MRTTAQNATMVHIIGVPLIILASIGVGFMTVRLAPAALGALQSPLAATRPRRAPLYLLRQLLPVQRLPACQPAAAGQVPLQTAPWQFVSCAPRE